MKSTTATFKSGSALGHSFTKYHYNNDATYTKDGTETATCDRCGATDTRTKTGTKLTPTDTPKPTTPIGFVDCLYSDCLDRKPDAAGLTDWSAKLRDKTQSGREVAYGFIFSKEFQGKNYSDEDYVEHLYASFLGRKSEADGKADWVNRLKNGKSREDVFNGFVGSQEFSDICANYGINRG